ncbi:TCR/Tet family MFS transporter [Mucilaginibacter sp. SG564]|uniref:TCR/Tet family MFS transporter n=1 Tax=Mucilaginibacter sp. SG564 TaxID=2587022 RepID=UPI001552750D|nr:TCR/Tet family MFS transporter [Mucilaginibacter sp. SG564]NOW93747.1 DHA1 family tetracycline resistance protein-like MFS transporter [Mucilaginibacter sp. SG564]
MKNPLFVIFTAIALDAVGIGLIFPILPGLLREVTHTSNVAPYIGITTALYAVMQFVFAPVLGALSDRLGRRPVLLISLGGAAISYVLMASASTLWLLLIGRAIAGLTSANMAVATAYITDISPEDKRAGRFGVFNAMFGVGFIIGPVLGGLLGDYWLRLPFIVAAGLNACNMLLALFVLAESRKAQQEKIDLSALNPLQPMKWAFSMKVLAPLILVFFIFSFSGEVYGTCWALWGADTFKWNGLWIGLSLGAFGVCQALVQAFLTGPAVKLMGDRPTIFVGLACACLALVVMALAKQSWMIFAIMPVFALGGIGTPALQSLATKQVEKGKQGQFQGVLTSVISLSAIIGPLVFSSIYFLVQKQWPGAVWLSNIAVYMIIVPIVMNLRLKKEEPGLINDLD